MAENLQMHGHVLASKVLLCLCAATCTACYIDPWLWREGGEEESPPRNQAISQSSISPWFCVTFPHITVKSHSPAGHRRGGYLKMYQTLSHASLCLALLHCCSSETLGHHRTVALTVHTKGRWPVSAPRSDPREGQ